MHSNLACKAPDQRGRLGLDGHQSRYRFAVLRNDDALGLQPVEDRETLLLELYSSDRAHGRQSSTGQNSAHSERRPDGEVSRRKLPARAPFVRGDLPAAA